MIEDQIKKLEVANKLLLREWLIMKDRLTTMEGQRNKFVHKYRKVCKAYSRLCRAIQLRNNTYRF